MSQFGLALIQAVELFISDISSTFWTFLGVDEQSVHFEANCHRGRSVTVDQEYSGRSVVVQMSLGLSVGGRSVKVPLITSFIAEIEINWKHRNAHSFLNFKIL
jgi:hypothetical protein